MGGCCTSNVCLPILQRAPSSPSYLLHLEQAQGDLYEPLLGDQEREAVANLLQYLESMLLFFGVLFCAGAELLCLFLRSS